MQLNRRQWFGSLTAGALMTATGCRRQTTSASAAQKSAPSLRTPGGDVDWAAVRDLFPLRRDWIHLASFLLVSHPAPVAEAIETFRKKIDADPAWIEQAAFSESEGRPFTAVKRALAEYAGGVAEEICLTPNTTTALAMAYHGLTIRSDQHILTTEHDHYSHHESIRFASSRSGCGVRYVALYDRPADARADRMVERLAGAIGPRTRAVGVTWVHSGTGVKVPIAAMADAVARVNRGRATADRCLLIVDGVHGFANQDVAIARLGCDFFAAGTHKWLFAPRGTGFLWGRKDVWPEMRPTIPSFDPDAPQTWDAWMNRTSLPPTQAWFVSPGGFYAYEHLLAIKSAVDLHHSIGRDRIAARIRDLNAAFRREVKDIKGVTLHTPQDPDLSGGLSCYEIAGLAPDQIETRLAAKRIRTSTSPYKTPYARVAAGVMNTPDEIEIVLREIRTLAGA